MIIARDVQLYKCCCGKEYHQSPGTWSRGMMYVITTTLACVEQITNKAIVSLRINQDEIVKGRGFNSHCVQSINLLFLRLRDPGGS